MLLFTLRHCRDTFYSRLRARRVMPGVRRLILKGEEMKFLILVTTFLAVGFICECSQQSAGGSPDANDSIFKSYGFPSHPDLTHLCRKRVYGSGREITWDAFASSAKPSELVDYYLQKLGEAGFTREGEGGTWRLPAGAPRPNRVLSITAVGTQNPSRDCEKSPPSDSRAFIILSRMS
jgi:hypothetical protein